MPELLSHIKSNPSTFTPTLKRALSSTLDLCLDWFKQLPSAADVQQKWTQMDAQYNLTGTTVNFFKTSVKYLLNDEQIRHWLYMATCFLVLIVWKSTVKMMKAPGKPTVMIARALFEANPQKYFSNLRGN
ncbi:hypothetical protein L1987_22618 [Smallanthus sonchifolius]|uniref:Uncharacterized protein n=1 Tax=Smallanthus sonchifolius TaxID=185202 RepID=A0ACB9IFI5_9ASTR|nr:hypothetical protein L1987_22618 [Smallanthus sonchifolius]